MEQDYGTKNKTTVSQDYGGKNQKKLICGMRGRYKDSALTVSEPGNYILWGSDQ